MLLTYEQTQIAQEGRLSRTFHSVNKEASAFLEILQLNAAGLEKRLTKMLNHSAVACGDFIACINIPKSKMGKAQWRLVVQFDVSLMRLQLFNLEGSSAMVE
jgi:hypothetical protein